MAPAPAPTPKPKPGDAGKVPLWAWGAAALVGLLLGFTVLRGKGLGGSSAGVSAPSDAGSGDVSAYPQGGSQGASSGDDKGASADVLAALGLLGDQLQGISGQLQNQPAGGSGGAGGAGGDAGSSSIQTNAPQPVVASVPAPQPLAPGTYLDMTINSQGVTELPSYGPTKQTNTPQPAVGVEWGGQIFTTKAALGSWLSARGANYATWAQNHPTAATKLK